MPEIAEVHPNEAIRQIAERLAVAGINAKALSAYKLGRYRGHQFIAGWEFSVQFADISRQLRLLVPIDAPWECSRVALVDAPLLQWPHVSRDGILCLRPNSWTINPDLPGDAALHELGAAAELIDDLVAGKGDADFREEFRSYWALTCSDGNRPIYSIAEPIPPSRNVHVWRGQPFALIGDTPEAVIRWVRTRFPDIREKELVVEQAAFVWLDAPPTPSEYPGCVGKMMELSARSETDLRLMLEGIQASDSEEMLIIFGARSTGGTGLIGVSISPSTDKYRPSPLNKGFREGKAPVTLVTNRILGGKLAHRTVDRADPAWVHGRDQDARQPLLQRARVAILGCGSVGSHVADHLASAGIGNLLHVDPEHLSWANVGRHVLGAEFVGKSKVESLARQIGKRLPHLKTLGAEAMSWQDVTRSQPNKLADQDLIISTMGDWSSEAQLNSWHLKNVPAVPFLYGWTEAYCCAGHAVAIRASSGCLQCGFSSDGIPTFQVGHWPNGPTIRQEPACGADFQPYGPVEMAHVCAMIAEFALDCILVPPETSFHRVWAGSERLMGATEGQWTEGWQQMLGCGPFGSRQAERVWGKSTSCPACGRIEHA